MIEIFVLLTFATAIAEIIMSGRWLPFYFRNGIPLYLKSFQVMEPPTLSADDLSRKFSSGIAAPIIFHRIRNDEIGFREKAFSFRLFNYTPIMHGLIHVDQSKYTVKMVGYANWTTIIFPIAFLSIDYSFSQRQPTHPPTTLFLVAIFAVLYLIQFIRFNRVFKFLEDKFSGKSHVMGSNNT